MAGVPDKALVKQSSFAAGIHNATPEQRLPRDEDGNPVALRAAVNVDIVDGMPRTRVGRKLVLDGRWHSPGKLTRRALVAVRNGDLVQVVRRPTYQTVLLRAGVGERRISYCEVDGDLLWSNGQQLRRLRSNDLADLTDAPAWIDCPGIPNAEAYGSGGLSAGNYAVAMTWLDARGRESGARGQIDVDVTQGQGIRVFSIPPAPEGAVRVRIYVSPCNGDELYAAKDLLPGASNVLLTAGDVNQSGKALETLWLQPFPACDILRSYNGRLFGAKHDLLYWSPAMRYGLHHHDAYMRLGGGIPMMEPLEGAGMWIADDKKTYWLQGTDPKKDWRRITVSDKSAVRGMSIIVPGTVVGVETSRPVAFWLASDGVFCVGMPDGSLVRLKEGQLALPYGEEGSLLLREHSGLRQMLATYYSRGSNNFAITDRAIATVTRY